MQLKVQVSTNVYEGFELEETLVSFDDAEKIGQKVGRAVRNWIREVPLTKNGRRMRIEVNAGWHEAAQRAAAESTENGAAAKPARRRRKRAS
jgi:hypothetical protein